VTKIQPPCQGIIQKDSPDVKFRGRNKIIEGRNLFCTPWREILAQHGEMLNIDLTRHSRSYQLSGLAVILKAEGIKRHSKGSFRDLRID
jgi:hypothetical protein